MTDTGYASATNGHSWRLHPATWHAANGVVAREVEDAISEAFSEIKAVRVDWTLPTSIEDEMNR